MKDLEYPPTVQILVAMREVAQSSLHLNAPRASRSLSADGRTSPSPRRAGDRESRKKLERSNSLTNNRTTIPLLPVLSAAQIQVLRKSWKHINTKGLNGVFRRCFQRLESANPAVSAGFRTDRPDSESETKTVIEHSKFLVGLFHRVIMDGEEDLDVYLRQIGARHAFLNEECGIGVPELERLGELIAEVVLKLDGVRQSKEATKIWRLMISKVIDYIRDGFETELRMQRRKISTFTPGIDNRRNSMPSSQNRKQSMKLNVGPAIRKFSNFR
ncbi:unnamed protein product [Bursaphelenchus okinawaensis]|uniref:Globin domain-containing protein n=1 Tax=Bursaphelenchus okinawaensis TaxID=465554 RepID=A0A811K8H2_9BILA|nr:unnamed protein product [Bursaphelenchus okinawaensis]CAG9093993.1 unnamed protein product [Bursaphelenchus okinawaensis]